MTLSQQLIDYDCVDVDDVFWPQISKSDIEVFSRTPVTKEVFDAICRLMDEKIQVESVRPMFGVVILDCEVVVYLDISDELLEEHCRLRGDTTYADASFVKKCIEEDWINQKDKGEKTFHNLAVTE